MERTYHKPLYIRLLTLLNKVVSALNLRDFRLPVRCKSDLSSEKLRRVDWQLVIDVSRQPAGPIFNGQAVRVFVVETVFTRSYSRLFWRNFWVILPGKT